MEIVVGVAGGVRSDAAVRWGAQEASRSGAPLVLLHAYVIPAVPSVGGPLRTPQMRADATLAAAAVLDHARRTAVTASPNAPTATCEAVRGAADDVLTERANRAQMLVVGGHGNVLPGHRIGRTVSACLRKAQCPVVVVPAGP